MSNQEPEAVARSDDAKQAEQMNLFSVGIILATVLAGPFCCPKPIWHLSRGRAASSKHVAQLEICHDLRRLVPLQPCDLKGSRPRKFLGKVRVCACTCAAA